MSRLLGASLLSLAACGRLGFDAAGGTGGSDGGDGPGPRDSGIVCGHDEDGDGQDDCLDPCPHVFDVVNPDSDGDGVGDDCDPRPENPDQVIAVFDAFTSQLPSWRYDGGATAGGDQLQLPGTQGPQFAYIERDYTPGRLDQITWGGTLDAIDAGGATIHSSIEIGSSDGGLYYCELIRDPADGIAIKYSWSLDEVMYFSETPVDLGQTFTGAVVTLRMYVDDAGNVLCTGTANGSQGSVAGVIPAVSANEFRVTSQALDTSVQYVIHVHEP